MVKWSAFTPKVDEKRRTKGCKGNEHVHPFGGRQSYLRSRPCGHSGPIPQQNERIGCKCAVVDETKPGVGSQSGGPVWTPAWTLHHLKKNKNSKLRMNASRRLCSSILCHVQRPSSKSSHLLAKRVGTLIQSTSPGTHTKPYTHKKEQFSLIRGLHSSSGPSFVSSEL